MKNLFITTVLGMSLTFSAIAEDGHHHVNENKIVKSQKLTSNVYMLQGEGGNIGVVIDDEQILIVDSQFAKLSDEIKGVIATISDKPITYLLNTHFHFDHTGGNKNFAESGADIIAHQNARARLKFGAEIPAFGKTMEPAEKSALPVIDYKQEMNIYLDKEDIGIWHMPNAHTDGDSVIFIKTANVVHTGDIYFSGMFPFIDTHNGGSVKGVIAAQEEIAELASENTVIIPGHGEVSNKAMLLDDIQMLKDIDAAVNRVGADKPLEILLALPDVKRYADSHGKGVLNAEAFIKATYK